MKNSDKKSRLGASNHPSKSDAKSDARSDANTDVAPDRTNPQPAETIIVNALILEVDAMKTASCNHLQNAVNGPGRIRTCDLTLISATSGVTTMLYDTTSAVPLQ